MIINKDAIELTPYDKQWSEKAALEIKQLYQWLPAKYIVDIQHVGSTAVRGMCAKPIIDIQIAVNSLVAIKQEAIKILESVGYVYWHKNPDHTRLFFAKGMPPFGEKRTHHVHIVEFDSKHWREKIQFRDYLISHPEVARDYEKLKTTLSQKYKDDREKYTEAKTEFIHKVLKTISNPD